MLPLEANDRLWSLALPPGADRDHEFCNPAKAVAPEVLAGLPRGLFAWWLRDQDGVEVVVKTDYAGSHASELFVPERAEELFACCSCEERETSEREQRGRREAHGGEGRLDPIAGKG
ncbi:hypothetical protein C2845_PM06G15900 [Panicum miliaceum]|uniref:Uncharacterized protein n=1 Tax=Panicum miliaceum TaxID=4540 RepID=A0A3L6R578_PANMI|nr:hypothetical protein C2845_PM06G15900 [Panicum miliaceum]